MGRSITPVILCGGSGTRLWPLSTGARPKPFHVIEGGETLLQATARRLAPGPDADFLAPIVICAAAHHDLVTTQLAAIGVKPALIVVEREGRGTAVAAGLAALAVKATAPGSLMLLAPADHRVDEAGPFRMAVNDAVSAARRRIVLFAARADRPDTGYGYVRPGRSFASGGRRVEAFVEKPSRPRAEAMLRDGGWAWNAGMFLTDPAVMLDEIAHHAPEVDGEVHALWTAARRRGRVLRLAQSGRDAPAPESLDRAVIEHSRRLAVVPCDMSWADVGCWRGLWRAGRRDRLQNRLEGPATVVDSTGCMVWSSGKPVAVIGMTDVVVVTTEDGVLVMPRDRAQEVGRLRLGV